MAAITKPVLNPASESFHTRAYSISSSDDAKLVYNDWANSYNAHVLSENNQYVGPKRVADALVKHLDVSADNEPLYVIDAGVGTGLAGIELAASIARSPTISNPLVLDGLDISSGMLEAAKETKIYRHLIEADLNQPITSLAIPEASYDAVICVGTLTEGHVGPSALTEFLKLTKPGGLIASSILEKIWESHGYKAEIERLKQDGQIEVLQNGVEDYRIIVGIKARVLVLKKLTN